MARLPVSPVLSDVASVAIEIIYGGLIGEVGSSQSTFVQHVRDSRWSRPWETIGGAKEDQLMPIPGSNSQLFLPGVYDLLLQFKS